MNVTPSRRRLLQLAAGAGAARLAGAGAGSLAAGQADVTSGGIGLPRREFEAAYGAGTPWNDLLAYDNVNLGVPGAKLYVRYLGEVVAHIEVGWSMTTQSGGIDWATAYQAAMSLLPADAEEREQYWLPATPQGPVMMIAHVYESAGLGGVTHGLERILALFQRKEVQMNASAPLEPIIMAVTLTVASPGQ